MGGAPCSTAGQILPQPLSGAQKLARATRKCRHSHLWGVRARGSGRRCGGQTMYTLEPPHPQSAVDGGAKSGGWHLGRVASRGLAPREAGSQDSGSQGRWHPGRIASRRLAPRESGTQDGGSQGGWKQIDSHKPTPTKPIPTKLTFTKPTPIKPTFIKPTPTKATFSSELPHSLQVYANRSGQCWKIMRVVAKHFMSRVISETGCYESLTM